MILLSGGLDSTVSLALSLMAYDIDSALFIDYSQLAARREEEAAKAIAGHYGIPFFSIAIPWLGELSSSALTGGDAQIPDYTGRAAGAGAAPPPRPAISEAVWVENRNGIFVNIAAAYAASRGCAAVITGFNREEASTFPDNSPAFVDAVNGALSISTGVPMRVESPTILMEKREIAARGIELEIPWELLWSCYREGGLMCGKCESCVRLMAAVRSTPAEGKIEFARPGDSGPRKGAPIE